MKHWGKITGCLFAMLLAFVSVQAQAATKAQSREFNHMSTGFPLTGVHAMTPCETCHVGGVFVGTPRVCDGCHAVGKRVVATPKSLKHIVTDAPCETCHFNTSTFFGARYNHGTAVPGQCTNCHNGRIVEGTPRNHPVSPIPGVSCDSCHRSSSWLPASWNHTDTASDCSTCHKAGGPGRNYVTGHLPMSMDTQNFATNCKACHSNYYTFYSAFYNHAGASTACGNCHQFAAYGPGVKQIVSTAAHNTYVSATITQCQSCHKSYGVGTFAAGRYDHASGATCDTCHSGKPWAPAITQITSTAAHNVYSTNAVITNCGSCHKSTIAWAGSRYDHVGAGACQTCHTAANSPTIRAMATNHIPIATTATCSSCHISAASWASVSMQHNATQIALTPCKGCHLGSPRYLGSMETKGYGHKGFSSGQDCIDCHKQQYSSWNHP
jgi:nitrate/TMAO reductase-like tetraheme cytochrome c subunit